MMNPTKPSEARTKCPFLVSASVTQQIRSLDRKSAIKKVLEELRIFLEEANETSQ